MGGTGGCAPQNGNFDNNLPPLATLFLDDILKSFGVELSLSYIIVLYFYLKGKHSQALKVNNEKYHQKLISLRLPLNIFVDVKVRGHFSTKECCIALH